MAVFSGVSKSVPAISVAVVPGQTQFTRTPRPLHSMASCRVNPSSPCLAEVYATPPVPATWEAIDPMLTMAPPLSIEGGAAA